MTLTDIHRMLQTAATKLTYLSAAHVTFPKIDHIPGPNASLPKYNKIEINFWILSDNREIKPKINNKKSYTKHWNIWDWVTHFYVITWSSEKWGRYKKHPRIKWKLKHKLSETEGYIKGIAIMNFITIISFIK
jgi:hypothetical protein